MLSPRTTGQPDLPGCAPRGARSVACDIGDIGQNCG
jgi:hypothetical protein